MAENRFSTQIISGAGEFDAPAMEHFIKSVNRHGYGLSYAVVAIIGPQSSGKSTLLNYLFGTHFKEMNAIEGRSQTTTGIWMAKAAGIDPLTLVMDLEGSDSRVREEDTTFEKRSALFALAMADIVIINIWCIDIGLQNAACRPLLKTVLEVNLHLFARKKMLLFAIRDKTKTPIEKLEHDIKEDIKKLWEGLPKPDAYKDIPLSESFNVEVIALASYAYQEELFEKEVAKLGQRFFNPTTLQREVLAGDGRNAVPLTDFCWKADLIWKKIKENKDIDIPALSILVATVRCKEIANENLRQFKSDEEWMALERDMDVDPGAISGFGKRASSILKRHFKKYDDECKNYDGGVRTTAKREYLEEKALELAFCCYKKLLEHLRSVSCRNFKNHLEDLLRRGEGFAAAARTCLQEFDQRCSDGAIEQANWEEYYKKVRYELLRDIVEELKDKYKKKLSYAIETQVKTQFDESGPEIWASIRELLGRENDDAGSGFSSAVAGFELERAEVAKMLLDLKAYATNLVEKISRERAKEALQHMNQRFAK